MTNEFEETPQTIHTNPSYKGKVYGIELEIEAPGLYEQDEVFNSITEEYEMHTPEIPGGWLREQEDSIQGVELISAEPQDFMTSVSMIHSVFHDIQRQGFTPIRTPRGSTHIHANVADLTWDQMRSFVMACAWAEPVLIELAGKGRKGNLFAQSYETTPVGWYNIIEWCRRKSMGQVLDTHYMAISFSPMNYLGSVEFRMGPSARNAEDAIRWLSCIDLVVSHGRTQLVDLREPEFLQELMSKMDVKKQELLRAKAKKQAEEIFYGINEPYEKPVIKVRGKKNISSMIAEIQAQQAAYSHFLNMNVPLVAPPPLQASSEGLAGASASVSAAAVSTYDPIPDTDPEF